MKIEKGSPLPLGIQIEKNSVNFSVVVPEKEQCELLLYKAGETVPDQVIKMKESVGDVRFLLLQNINPKEYEYNYRIGEQIITDPFAKALTGRSTWNVIQEEHSHEVRGILYTGEYDWGKDRPLRIPYQDVIAYSLHVRGFTKHSSSLVKKKGTFAGVIEKIPYLTKLGINQIQCMPVYDFLEHKRYVNYWGYGKAYYFAPKAAYAAAKDAAAELKDMVKACHKENIEVVLYLPFTETTPHYVVSQCLRYYAMEFHMDGFILEPAFVQFAEIIKDPLLADIKIMRKEEGFQNVMRRFLKGDEGMVNRVIWWTRHHSKQERIFNHMTAHNGFTLYDTVSYDGKHNEKNGEQNQDGTDYNYSWNCGAEGVTRKKSVLELRKKQMRNAFFLLLMSQGTPCILAGDEFANTQKGNNNAYCQDNETTWLNWKSLEKETDLFTYVKALIAFRKSHPILHPGEELKGIDETSCGVPDVSYHGESAWQIPSEMASRQLGIYYSGSGKEQEDCFIAYNMHWEGHSFALPALKRGKKWYRLMDTNGGIYEKQIVALNQREVDVDARTIVMFIGR